MNGFEVYSLYVGLKTHFKNNHYNFAKFGIPKIKHDTFLGRRDRYFFEKIAKKYSQKELTNFFVSNFLHNENIWIGDFFDSETEEVYTKWKKRYESLEYRYEQDLQTIIEYFESSGLNLNNFVAPKDGELPLILQWVTQNKITPETYAILDTIYPLSKKYLEIYKDDVIFYDIIKKYAKYRIFLGIEKNIDFFREKLKTAVLGNQLAYK